MANAKNDFIRKYATAGAVAIGTVLVISSLAGCTDTSNTENANKTTLVYGPPPASIAANNTNNVDHENTNDNLNTKDNGNTIENTNIDNNAEEVVCVYGPAPAN